METITYADYKESPEHNECIRVVTEFENTGSVPETSLTYKDMKTFINSVETEVDGLTKVSSNSPFDAALQFELKESKDRLDEARRCFQKMFPS